MKTRIHPAAEVLEARITPALVHPFPLQNVDGSTGVKIAGSGSEVAGEYVSNAGDINNDGFDDLIIGAPKAAPNGARSGAAYVLFGSADPQPVTRQLANLNGTNGFKLNGVDAEAFTGYSVSAAGDVNGDGFDDLLVGARGQTPNTGAAFVVFGKGTAFPAVLELSSLNGTTGFKIPGVANADYTGGGVAAGDINGDGFSDVIVGAPGVDVNGEFNTGVTYVVFGKGTPFSAVITPASLDGTVGFKLVGEDSIDFAGCSVAAGDINGDGFDEIIVGAKGLDSQGFFTGGVYVFYGKANNFAASVGLSTLAAGMGGFKVNGTTMFEQAGFRVSAGDINGDSRDDIIIGGPAIGEDEEPGAAYVVFGKTNAFTSTVELSSLNGTDGFRVDGVQDGSGAGYGIAFAGDVNNDGFGDFLVSSDEVYTGQLGNPAFGETYLVFGHSGTFPAVFAASSIDGTNGVTFRGTPGDYSGHAVSGAGDFNGDGFDDLLIGTLLSGTAPGLSFLVFGGEVSDAPPVKVASNGKSATFTDADGDLITVKTSRGEFTTANFEVVGGGGGGVLDRLNIAGNADFAGAKITISAKAAGGGDGKVQVGKIDAAGIDLGKVTIKGALGELDCGDGNISKPALKSLTVLSLGAAALTNPAATLLTSAIKGDVGKVKIKGDVEGGGFEVDGGIKSLTVAGSLVGGAEDFSGFIFAEGFIKKATVGGSLEGGAGLDSGTLESGAGFGKVVIKGDLDGAGGQGSGGISAFGPVKSITVNGSLLGGGAFGAGSIFTGGTGDAGAVGTIRIGGGVVGGTDTRTGLILGSTVRSITIQGDVLGTAAVPVKIVAEGLDSPANAAAAVAIGNLSIGGKIESARILAGYDAMLDPTHADASIGKVLVKKTWAATSLVAGVDDATDDGFGQNDTLIAGGNSSILARIASLTIKQTATGSAAMGDHFGITAEQIGKVTVAGQKLVLDPDESDNLLLDATNADFRLVELM